MNPKDNCGIIHNMILDSLAGIANHYLLTEEEILQNVVTFHERITGHDDNLDIDIMLASNYTNTMTINDITTIQYSNNLITLEQKEYILEIHNIFTTADSYEIAQTELNSLANSLYYDDNLDTEEKEIIWGGLSIANHSLIYWEKDLADQDSPWWDALNKSINESNADSIAVVACDVGGFFVGIWKWGVAVVTSGPSPHQCYAICKGSAHSASARKRLERKRREEEWGY